MSHETNLSASRGKGSMFCSLYCIHPYPAKFIYLNFQQLEVVSRYRDPQHQVVENHSYLLI